jgi:hypothetical protein
MDTDRYKLNNIKLKIDQLIKKNVKFTTIVRHTSNDCDEDSVLS